MKALIYARCSTDEKRQDVDVQLKALRRRCDAEGWDYDEVAEYGSGYKGKQPELDKCIEKIRQSEYKVLLVYSMDRFSRQNPRKVNDLVGRIVEDYKCRFITIMESIDSSNEMIWHGIRPLMVYFANLYSKQLGEKVKAGIKNAKDKKTYTGGRPSKEDKVNFKEVMEIYSKTNSLRKTAAEYNKTRYKDNRISRMYVKRILSGDIKVSVAQKPCAV